MKNLKELFSRYLKKKKASDHAVLSASGAERWLGCPGSRRLCEGMPSVDNAAGIRGTNTHTLLQFIQENAGWKSLLTTREGLRFKQMINFDKSMLNNALFAANFVKAERERLVQESGRPVTLFVEKKVELKSVGFGTSDVILTQPYGELHVMDYKNGTKAVEPERNWQGLYYAHAVADMIKWEFTRLKITIIQPNAPHKRGAIRTWVASFEDLMRAGRILKRGARATEKPNAPLVKNDGWCWFCPARQKCPLHREEKTKKFLERFGIEEYV